MNVPRKYWGEAVRSAAYLINRTPSRVLDFKTPLQKLKELVPSPSLNSLEPRVFGCLAYVHQAIGKLNPRAIRCIFIGYADLQKGIGVMIRMLKRCMLLGMFSSMKMYLFSLNPSVLFKGRKFRTSLKITL